MPFSGYTIATGSSHESPGSKDWEGDKNDSIPLSSLSLCLGQNLHLPSLFMYLTCLFFCLGYTKCSKFKGKYWWEATKTEREMSLLQIKKGPQRTPAAELYNSRLIFSLSVMHHRLSELLTKRPSDKPVLADCRTSPPTSQAALSALKHHRYYVYLATMLTVLSQAKHDPEIKGQI